MRQLLLGLVQMRVVLNPGRKLNWVQRTGFRVASEVLLVLVDTQISTRSTIYFDFHELSRRLWFPPSAATPHVQEHTCHEVLLHLLSAQRNNRSQEHNAMAHGRSACALCESLLPCGLDSLDLVGTTTCPPDRCIQKGQGIKPGLFERFHHMTLLNATDRGGE